MGEQRAMASDAQDRRPAEGRPASRDELMLRRRQGEDRLAADIIEECRVQLMLKFRFLDRALWRMGVTPVRSGLAYPIATDGKEAYCDPQRTIARFQLSFDEAVRDCLHLILHCIFRHPYDATYKVAEAWSLTCDMVVESVAMDLCATRFASEDDAERRAVIDEVAMLAGGFVPGKVYGLLKAIVEVPQGQSFRGLGRSQLNAWHQLFERDDHGTWPASSRGDGSAEAGEGQREELQEDDEQPDVQRDSLRTEALEGSEPQQQEGRSDWEEGQQSAQEGAPEAFDASGQDAAGAPPSASGEEPQASDEDAERKGWEDIAKEVEMNLETFSKEWGDEAGSLVAALSVANRRTYDYTDFLRRFMTVTEQLRINPEEFDYTYYLFGMETYGNMPFIEPLEYKEAEAVRDFAIVIDTSESVKGALVQRFVEHTFSILQEGQDRATTVNVHVIQADSKVQSDLLVSDLRDVAKMMEGFAVRGFGGTDFRPAFDYVAALRESGELAGLKGMIYFTDGLGEFPERPPDFDVAFVMMDDGSREVAPVPPWAMKVVIDERDIERLR